MTIRELLCALEPAEDCIVEVRVYPDGRGISEPAATFIGLDIADALVLEAYEREPGILHMDAYTDGGARI